MTTPPPQPFQSLICPHLPKHPDKESLGFVDLTAGIVKQLLSMISPANHGGDKRQRLLATHFCDSLKGINAAITHGFLI